MVNSPKDDEGQGREEGKIANLLLVQNATGAVLGVVIDGGFAPDGGTNLFKTKRGT
jgi:hypothetical protein